MTDQTSELLYMRAKLRLPGGVNSPVRAYQAVGRTPRFIQSAKGSHITDVDGNEMIDYVCSWGPGILGHADPRVIEKVKAACEEGLTFGAPTEREVEMAELLAQLVPSMEVSRLVSSGTEATMSAIRVARGYTKRDKIIKFRGCYHGHSDGLLVKAGSAALTTSVPDSAGVPADFTRHTLVAEYNSPDSVKALFEAYPDEIAAIIVEPVAANMGVIPPSDGFLEFCVRSQNIMGHFSSLTRSSPAFVWHWAEHRGIFILRRICPRLERLSVEVCRSARMVEERISCVWFPRTVRFIRQEHFPAIRLLRLQGLPHFVFWRQIRIFICVCRKIQRCWRMRCAMPQETVCMSIRSAL